MASVRRRDPKDPNSPWVCEYTDAAGKRHRYTPKTGLKKDADAFRKKIEGELERGEHIAASEDRTVEQLCEEYLRHIEVRWKDGRVGRGRYDVLKVALTRSVIPMLGRIYLAKLTSEMIEEFYRRMLKEQNLKPRTAKDRVGTVRQLEVYAVKRGYMKRTPAIEALAELRGIRRTPIRTFTSAQVGQILAATMTRPSFAQHRCWKKVVCFIHIAAFCGLRFGEISGLTRPNIDLGRRLIRVRHNLTAYDELKGPKTKAGVRDVPMPPHVAAMLSEWIETDMLPNDRSLVFRTSEGGRFASGNFSVRFWRPLLRRAGVLTDDEPYHFHALRHFAASWMIEHGLPLTDVAALMGHESYDMTLQVYAHPVGAEQRRIDTFDRMAETLLLPAPEAPSMRLTSVSI